MKYLKFQLMAALLCLTAIVQAQSNVLRVDPVETPAGKTLILPVVMENQSDVTGVQFDIRVPYQLTVGDDNKVVVNLSKTRVKQHLNEVYEKLSAANRAEAVAIAIRRQLLKS